MANSSTSTRVATIMLPSNAITPTITPTSASEGPSSSDAASVAGTCAQSNDNYTKPASVFAAYWNGLYNATV